MSSFMSNKYLRFRPLLGMEEPPIDHDAFCVGCGYNLRGLKPRGRCPECGMEMSRGRDYRFSILIPFDHVARRRMSTGLRIAALSFGILVLCRLWLLAPIPGRDDLLIVDVLSLAASVVWVAAILMVTPRSLNRYGAGMRIIRRIARWSQFAWPIAFAAIVYYDSRTAAGAVAIPDHARTLWLLGRAVGGAGVLAFLWMMSDVARDAECDEESRWLAISFWGLLIVTPLAGLIPRGIAPVGMGWVAYGFLSIFIVLWGILAMIPVVILYRLGSAASISGRDLDRWSAQQERIRETRRVIDSQVRATVRPLNDGQAT